MAKLQEKFQGLAASLKSQFVERDEMIDGMMCAALAGEHVLLVGAPGAAKSALVNAFTSAVTGANLFEWLLGKFTAPEELFGPVSLKALKDERYARVTTGKLPEAQVAFIDEVFKASSAILNTLLPILNERKFYNNGKPNAVPLRMLVGASNELPDGAELAALYDRFLMRYWVSYVEQADNWVAMVSGATKGTGATITLQEWDAARAEVEGVACDEGVARELFKLRNQLRAQHVQVSDRRWKQCVRLLKAAAWMSGESEVLEDHFTVLAAALWNEQGEIAKVKEVVEAAAGSTANEATKIVETISDMIDALPDTAPGQKLSNDKQQQMIEANREGARALAKLRDLNNSARTARAKQRVGAAIKEVEGKLGPMRQAMREQLGL
jgi:MoxR-like ATPase